MGFGMRLISLLIVLVMANGPVFAGAWAREKDELFIAAGGNFLLSDGAQLPVHYDPTLYAEYGLSERLTLGLNLFTADAGRQGALFFFARFPIGDMNAPDKFAVSVSFGARVDANLLPEKALRGGISWGRGLENGWLAIDASATKGTVDTTFRPKLDASWGHKWSDRWTTIAQLQTGQGLTDDYYAKIAPSIIYEITPKINIHLGAVHAFTGDRGSALKFETWLTF